VSKAIARIKSYIIISMIFSQSKKYRLNILQFLTVMQQYLNKVYRIKAPGKMVLYMEKEN